jgi:hypothetical protein
MRDVLLDEPQLAQRLIEPAPAPLLAPLAEPALGAHAAEGLDLILEGFLLHHGTPLHIDLDDVGRRVLAGDFCYAAGLVRVAEPGDLEVISMLAELISLATGLVAGGRREALVPLWLATAVAAGGRDRRDAYAQAVDALRAGHDAEQLAALAREAGDAPAARLSAVLA